MSETHTGAGGAAFASRSITYRDSIREALFEEMEDDPRVIILGEDVGRYGGAYAVSRGLL